MDYKNKMKQSHKRYGKKENQRDMYETESDNDYEDEYEKTYADEETLEPKKKRSKSETFFQRGIANTPQRLPEGR